MDRGGYQLQPAKRSKLKGKDIRVLTLECIASCILHKVLYRIVIIVIIVIDQDSNQMLEVYQTNAGTLNSNVILDIQFVPALVLPIINLLPLF